MGMAKSVVKSGLSARCLVQLSYAIGVAKPLSVFVETYGTERGALSAEDITNILKIEFDCRPGAIATSLALREPKYQETAAYCHFGREAHTKDGQVFRVGKRQGFSQVRRDDIGTVGRRAQGQRLPDEVGRLREFARRRLR